MQAEPCRTHRPLSCRHPQILRSAVAPYICIVVAGKAAAVIHLLSCHSAVRSHTLNVVKKRCVQLREVAVLGTPVVHLGIDIYSEPAAPCRPHILVPDALQVHRESALSAGRDHKIASEVMVKLYQLVVLAALFYLLQSLVCRQLGIALAVIGEVY